MDKPRPPTVRPNCVRCQGPPSIRRIANAARRRPSKQPGDLRYRAAVRSPAVGNGKFANISGVHARRRKQLSGNRWKLSRKRTHFETQHWVANAAPNGGADNSRCLRQPTTPNSGRNRVPRNEGLTGHEFQADAQSGFGSKDRERRSASISYQATRDWPIPWPLLLWCDSKS